MARIVSVFLPPPEASSKSRSMKTPGQCAQNTPPGLSLLQTAALFSPSAAWDQTPAGAFESGTMSLYRGINMDLTGSERLFGGIKQIIKSIVQTLNKQGLYCRIAAAPALGAAWALSRFGGQTTTIIEAHNLENALAPLPVAALRLPPPLAESLIELNITQIGHLLRIPRSAILSRFDGLLLQQLDLALGRRQEIIVPRKFPPPLKAKITFDGAAIEFTSLICAAQALLKKVLDQLAAHEELSRLVLEIKTLNAAPVFKSIELSVPGKDEKHLWRLLRCKLENIQIGFGIEYMTLSITHRQTRFAAQLHDPSIPVQQGKQSSSAAPANREFGTLLDVLSGQLAAEEICSLACFPSHLPEKSFAYLPLKHPRAPTSRMTNAAHQLTEAERPSLLFFRPHPVQAMAAMPDNPPFWLKWKNNTYRIVAGTGPERIAPEWWGKDDSLCAARDYFKVQLSTGTWMWIFREVETSNWFIHGIWT